MAGLKEVRIRIASVKSTQQITNAMKMVAASKLRKAQTAIIKLRPYAAKLREILQNLSASIDSSDENVFSQARPPEKILLVVIASNQLPAAVQPEQCKYYHHRPQGVGIFP